MEEKPRVEELLGQLFAELRLGEKGSCQILGPPEFVVTGPADALAQIRSGWDSVRYELAGRFGLLLPEPQFQLSAGFSVFSHRGEQIAVIPTFQPWVPRTVARLAEEMARFLSFSCTCGLLNDLFRRAPCYREEMERLGIPKLLVHQILRQLLAEHVPIHNLETILTAILDNWCLTQVLDYHLESVRVELSETICGSLAGKDRELRVLTIDPFLEHLIQTNIETTEHGCYLVIDPGVGYHILEKIEAKLHVHRGESKLVMLSSPPVRHMLRKLTLQSFPRLSVVSWNEIAPRYNVFSVGVVS